MKLESIEKHMELLILLVYLTELENSITCYLDSMDPLEELDQHFKLSVFIY